MSLESLISRLRGVLLEKHPQGIIVEVGGIGFGLQVPLSTFETLPEAGEETALLTWLEVKEDSLALYGFATANERDLFNLLISVKGIGPRIALEILSYASPTQFLKAITSEDDRFLSGIPGIGKKTAQRLIFELREKVDRIPGAAAVPGGGAPEGVEPNVFVDAVSGLVFLGCTQQQAEDAVTKALDEVGGDLPVEQIIREALKFRKGQSGNTSR